MLYTSVNISLALLEILVHADESEIPPKMFVSHIQIADCAPIYLFPAAELYSTNSAGSKNPNCFSKADISLSVAGAPTFMPLSLCFSAIAWMRFLIDIFFWG